MPFELPALPYPFDALEPHIDAQTMQIHHDKHHAAYVTGLNTALEKLDDVHKKGGDELMKVRGLTDAITFNGCGHVLHSIFWKNMKKGGGSEPQGALAKLIDRDFGSFAGFQAHFSEAAKSVQGGGWGMLAWGPVGQRLV